MASLSVVAELAGQAAEVALGQSAIFLSPADATITLVPTRKSQLTEVFGAESATADAFGFSGFIPENPASAEIITIAGPVDAAAD